MKSNNLTLFIIFTGITILCIFVVVVAINLLPSSNESNSYYVKVDEKMSAKIEELEILNNKLVIKTTGDAIKYCVKSTKSTPSASNICWKNIENNVASISVYKYKRYYIWIKDTSDNISSPVSVNTKN